MKGLAMGAADVIPGVSGGTIAFISGIYEELINSIKSINAKSLKLLFTFKFKTFWKAVNGKFLLALVSGILISFLSLAKLMLFLLHNYQVQVWAFFFGLVLASIWYVTRHVNKFHWSLPLLFVIGTILGYIITALSPTTTPDALWFIFLCGAIAVCVMILPAISGGFVLLLLGKYVFMMNALVTFDIVVIAAFVTGAVIGLVGFSNVLSWLLSRYRSATVVVLGGFLLGSLNKIWPWKETLETFVDQHGVAQPLLQKNVLPQVYEQITGNSHHLTTAILLFLIGFSIVFVIEFVAIRLSKATKA
jgi:putative membrane protein